VYEKSVLMMGPGQKILNRVGSIFCSFWLVRSAIYWAWKIFPKNIKFINFFPSDQKKSCRVSYEVSGTKAGQPLIYRGSKVCSVLVRAHL